MQTKMSAKEARDNFTDLLGSVYYGKQVVEIDKKGRVFAVVLNPEEYKALKEAAKGKFAETIKEVQAANHGVDLETVLDDVTKEVEVVRKKNYAKGR